MRNVLVTGGAGFIGSNFVDLLLAETDARVVVLDRLTYAGHVESLEAALASERCRLIEGDIADAGLLDALFGSEPIDTVVNFAAESHVDRSIDGPEAFIHTNLVGTFRLLEAARARFDALEGAARDGFRFLHVSTDEVYGTLGSEGAFHEETPYAPNSPYAATKAGADHLVRAHRETFGLPAIITNCSNNYGPRQYPEKLLPLVLLNALEAKDLPIYGDGGQVRDWLQVEDHCRGILMALQAGQPGRKYNIGGHAERTNLEIVDALCDTLEALRPASENPAMQARGVAVYRDLKTFVPDRPGHDRRYAIDASRARAELGWEPRYDLAAGLSQTVGWYLTHRDWCDAVQKEGNARGRRGLLDAD